MTLGDTLPNGDPVVGGYLVDIAFNVVSVGDKGIAFLDKLADQRFVVANTATYQRVELDPGEWEEVHDDDSVDVAYLRTDDASDDPPVVLSFHVLSKRMFERPDTHEQFILEFDKDDVVTSHTSLCERRARHSIGDVTFRIGCTSATTTIGVAVLNIPRKPNAASVLQFTRPLLVLGHDFLRQAACSLGC